MNAKKIIIPLIISLVLVITLGLGFANTVKAVEFDDDGVVGEGEVINDDLFIASDTVEINGTVKGDVFAAGGLVRVNGKVEGSLFTGAQTIFVPGEVAGSVYAGASTFTLEEGGTVGRNLFYGGFNLTTEEGSTIARDLLVGAYQALLSGEIGRDVQAGVGALEIDGSIGGDVFADVGSPEDSQQTVFFGGSFGVETIVPTGIRVFEDADIGGKLTYKSAQDQQGAIKAVPDGGMEFKYDPKPAKEGKPKRIGLAALIGSWFVQRLRVLITLLILGGLVVWQLPALLEKVSLVVQKKTVPTLGWGIVTIITFYVGALVVAGLIIAAGLFFGVITLGGLSKTIFTLGFSTLGIALALFGLLVSYVSKLVVSYATGKYLLSQFAPSYAGNVVWPMVLGIILYALFRAIPFLGWWIGVFVTLIGIGAMWLFYRDRNLQPVGETA